MSDLLLRSLVSEYLHRPVGNEECGSIRNLNEVPDWLMTQMEAWPTHQIWMRAPRVLKYFVVEINDSQALDFAENVVAKRKSAVTATQTPSSGECTSAQLSRDGKKISNRSRASS
jgi:hypothetical protein